MKIGEGVLWETANTFRGMRHPIGTSVGHDRALKIKFSRQKSKNFENFKIGEELL